MKKLSEYQEQYFEAREKKKQGGVGVACDCCGHELKGDSSHMLISNPPKIEVWCDNCNFYGYMNV